MKRKPRITAVCKLSSSGVSFHVHKMTILGAVYMDLSKKKLMGKEDGKCRVCCYRMGEYCLVPCGHVGFCQVCARRVKSCPFCSARVEHVQKLCQV